MQQLIDAMKTNDQVKILSLSNVEMPDMVGKQLCNMLESNVTLLTLNVESNHLLPTTLADICRSLNKNKSLIDLRLSNQRSTILGSKVEMDIASSIAQNTKLLRLGLHFNSLGPRVRIQETMKRNWDLCKPLICFKLVQVHVEPKNMSATYRYSLGLCFYSSISSRV
jgi:tropomodulin